MGDAVRSIITVPQETQPLPSLWPLTKAHMTVIAVVSIPRHACGSQLVQKVWKAGKDQQWRWPSDQTIMLTFRQLTKVRPVLPRFNRWALLSSFYRTITDFGKSRIKEESVLNIKNRQEEV